MIMDIHRSSGVGDKHAQQDSIPTKLPQEGRKEESPSDRTGDTN